MYKIFAHKPNQTRITSYSQVELLNDAIEMADILFKNGYSVYVYDEKNGLLDSTHGKMLQKKDKAIEGIRIKKHLSYKNIYKENKEVEDDVFLDDDDDDYDEDDEVDDDTYDFLMKHLSGGDDRFI